MQAQSLLSTVAAVILIALHPVHAQLLARSHKLGWLELSSPNAEVLRLNQQFRKRLIDLSYVELAAKHRLPAMYGGTEFGEVGGLLGYGPDITDNFRRAAIYADKILKGAKPADLPIERPFKFEVIVNLKTANHIGLTIPPNVLVRAD